jgi:hypothetical protein
VNLFRSHRDSSGTLDGWDCIVPGPADASQHNGACAVSSNRPRRAYLFISDPYDASICYVLDDSGVWLTTDGGATWYTVGDLTHWLSDGGQIQPTCRIACEGFAIVQELTNIEFVPDEPQVRFATGEAGVFFTINGATRNGQGEAWHRLLDSSALGCFPRNSYFDNTNTLGRTLYVACHDRSLLSFFAIPRAGDRAYVAMTYNPLSPYPSNIHVPSPPPAPALTPVAPFPNPGPYLGPTPTPAFTPVVPSVVQFKVAPTQINQACLSSMSTLPAFPITLDNTASNVAVSWQAFISDTDPHLVTWATASSMSGSIPPGQTAVVTVYPGKSLCQDLLKSPQPVDLHVEVADDQGKVLVTDTIAPPLK